MTLSEGSLLGANLRLSRVLGKGAMGTVWLAQNLVLDSPCAVKVLDRRDRSATGQLRFEQEARAVARLDSPHAVRVFDFGTTPGGDPYIVMELLTGRDLKSVITDDGPMALARVVTLVRQICRGLRRAHDLGIVHRDIKPANIFLVEVDGEPFVKIVDFGVAKSSEGADLALTETGALMGTPYYMSPEQFLSPRTIDHRTDLWSVAVVAYASLTAACRSSARRSAL